MITSFVFAVGNIVRRGGGMTMKSQCLRLTLNLNLLDTLVNLVHIHSVSCRNVPTYIFTFITRMFFSIFKKWSMNEGLRSPVES